MEKNINALEHKRYGKCSYCKELKFLISEVWKPVEGTYDNYWKFLNEDVKIVGYLCKECSVVESI